MHDAVPVEAINEIDAYNRMRAQIGGYGGQETVRMPFPPDVMDEQAYAAYQSHIAQSYPAYNDLQPNIQPQLEQNHTLTAGQHQAFYTNEQNHQMHQQATPNLIGFQGQLSHGQVFNISRRQIDNLAQRYARSYMIQYLQESGLQREQDIPNDVVTQLKRQAHARANQDASRAMAAARQRAQLLYPQPQYPPAVHTQEAQRQLSLMPSAFPPAQPDPENVQITEPTSLHSANDQSQQVDRNTPEEPAPAEESVRAQEIGLAEEHQAQEASSNEHADPGQAAQNPHVGATAASAAQNTRELVSDAVAKHQNVRRSFQHALVTVNNTYTQRAGLGPTFLVTYCEQQHTLVCSTYNLLANTTGLDEVAKIVWTADDATLATMLRTVSVRLKSLLPRFSNSVRFLLKDVHDPELRWTAVSKSSTMFYDSFSGLKAALVEREKGIEYVESFTKILNVDRKQVWVYLMPALDEELTAALTAENASRKSEVDAELEDRVDAEGVMLAGMLQGEIHREVQEAEVEQV